MKSKAESKKDNLVQQISESARAVERLAHQAVQQYADEVEAILNMQSRDSKRPEKVITTYFDRKMRGHL
jgi:alpha-glucuronidase